jgi:hypothetical protein
LDTLGARYILIAEVAEGFVWHSFKDGDPAYAMAGTFAFDDLPALIESIKQLKAARLEARQAELVRMAPTKRTLLHPLRKQVSIAVPEPEESSPHPICPLGYEETLRSLGNKLEDQRAHAVAVVEREATMLVRYSLPLPSYIRLDVSKQEMWTGLHENEYSPSDLRAMVAESRARRGVRYYQS